MGATRKGLSSQLALFLSLTYPLLDRTIALGPTITRVQRKTCWLRSILDSRQSLVPKQCPGRVNQILLVTKHLDQFVGE